MIAADLEVVTLLLNNQVDQNHCCAVHFRNMKYNIFSELQKEIDEFDSTGFYITGEPKSKNGFGDPGQKGKRGGYYFSQKDTLESCDMASASKYKKGVLDAEGQRKTFINIVNFYRDVMKMKIIIKVANYIFEPRKLSYEWPVWSLKQEFNIFADEESYDDELQDRAHDLATYGTVVSKRCADSTERVPLRTLRNTQSAKSLFHAASTGGYVIIEDDKHYNEMSDYPDWQLDGLVKSKSYQVFERYTLVPKSLYEDEAWKDNNGVIENWDENEEMILCQQILIPGEKNKGKFESGTVVWMERVDEDSWPLDECHSERVDGRWLGKGEVEKQLENQIARNLNANLRRRGLLWATRKIFAHAGNNGDDIPEQLLMEVKDGQTIFVGPNGSLSQVNTGNQHGAEFNADDQAWKENSQQNAFAFNITTGADMPSGMSFSLGVVLEKAVSDHFTAVRNRFSNYLKRDFFNQLIEIFKEEYSEEHERPINMDSDDIEAFKDSIIVFHANERYFDRLVTRKNPNMDQIRIEVEQELMKNQYAFLTVPDDFYENALFYMKLKIDDDIGPDVQTLTTIWQQMRQDGDLEGANRVLRQIMAKQGRSLTSIVGKPRPVAQPGSAPQPGGEAPVPTSPEAPAPRAPMTA